MEHQKEKMIMRSKKTTTRPIRLLLTSISLAPKLIEPEEHLTIMAYCQYFGAELGSEHSLWGRISSVYLNRKSHDFLPLH